MAIDKIKDMVNNKEEVIAKFNKLNVKSESIDNSILEDRISNIDKQINKLMDLYQLDNISIENLTERIENLSNEKKLLKEEIKIDPLDESIDVSRILKLLEDFDMVWGELDLVQKKEIARGLLGTKIIVIEKGLQ